MILGLLLITRPCAIFGSDYEPILNKPVSTSTVHPYMLPDDIKTGGDASNLISRNALNKDKAIHVNTTICLNVEPISLIGYFNAEPKPSTSGNNHSFTPTERLFGYIACAAVPLLSALISIVTRQCNNNDVPICILMFWFGIGAGVVTIIGKLMWLNIRWVLLSKKFAMGFWRNSIYICFVYSWSNIRPTWFVRCQQVRNAGHARNSSFGNEWCCKLHVCIEVSICFWNWD